MASGAEPLTLARGIYLIFLGSKNISLRIYYGRLLSAVIKCEMSAIISLFNLICIDICRGLIHEILLFLVFLTFDNDKFVADVARSVELLEKLQKSKYRLKSYY